MKSILILFLFFTSCTFKSLILSNASYLVANKVGNKIDLTWDQEKKLRKDIDIFFHQNIGSVVKISSYIEKIDLNKIDINLLFEQVYPIYSKLYLAFIPLISNPLSDYSQKQVKNLFTIAEDDNLTIKNRSRKDKTDEYGKRFEFFFGDITSKQLEILKGHKVIFQSLNKEKLSRRLEFQSKLRATFRIEDKVKKKLKVESIFSTNLNKEILKKRVGKLMPLLDKLKKSLSSEQKIFFEKRQVEIIQWLELFIKKYK